MHKLKLSYQTPCKLQHMKCLIIYFSYTDKLQACREHFVLCVRTLVTNATTRLCVKCATAIVMVLVKSVIDWAQLIATLVSSELLYGLVGWCVDRCGRCYVWLCIAAAGWWSLTQQHINDVSFFLSACTRHCLLGLSRCVCSLFCLSACLSVCLFVCLSVCLPACLSACVFVSRSAYFSVYIRHLISFTYSLSVHFRLSHCHHAPGARSMLYVTN